MPPSGPTKEKFLVKVGISGDLKGGSKKRPLNLALNEFSLGGEG